MECTHSRVASNGVPNAKQRVLVSAQYEQKIDTIASDLEIVKSLLQSTRVNVPSIKRAPELATWYDDKHDLHMVATHPWMNAAERRQRSNTSKITDIVRSVVLDIESGAIVSDDGSALSSLKSFLHIVDGPSKRRARASTGERRAPEQNEISLPPFDVAVTVLRWAKANHDDDALMGWMCHIQPREMFQEACQRVYFPIDDYDEADLILANGYLTYIFADYTYSTQIEDYRDHGELCRLNLHNAMFRLPLHAQPSLKLAAALALSAFSAIESSQAFMAWNFVSAALNMCQTLGYHCIDVYNAAEQAMQEAQSRLFWLVYRLERSLSLRFNRSSNIRDSEITIPDNAASMRHIRLGRVHGKIYELLYSPAALAERMRIGKTMQLSFSLQSSSKLLTR